jgi:hypothetical protein
MTTLFLLSPARTGGLRARQLARSPGELGVLLRAGRAPLGDVFAWLSALYFRGKLAYANAFGGALVMAPGLGLVAPTTPMSVAMLEAMGAIGIDSEAFTSAVARDARRIHATEQVVLLGSIATGKYVDTLIDVLGGRLMFPRSFVGRGDMSRGGLMLRAARSGEELAYAAVAGAVRHGARPAKLGTLPRQR